MIYNGKCSEKFFNTALADVVQKIVYNYTNDTPLLQFWLENTRKNFTYVKRTWEIANNPTTCVFWHMIVKSLQFLFIDIWFTFSFNQLQINDYYPLLTINPLQTIRQLLSMNCLSVFDHFVGLALKGLITGSIGNISAIRTLESTLFECFFCARNKH